MRRRAKPAKAKVEGKRRSTRKSSKTDAARVRDLETRLAEALQGKSDAFKQLETRDRELTDSLDRQVATAEILRVISSSPTDVQPVFDTIARNAVRVCDSTDALVALVEGNETVTKAHYGDQFVGGSRRPITRGLVVGRAVLEGRAIQVDDLTTARDFPEGRELALGMGHRTVMAMPLLRDGVAIGAILMRRSEVKPFSDKQITLLQTFADQAVIAIENVRLFTALQEKNGALTQAHAQVTESLEQQTATSEILKVISSSPTDVQPVFDAIVRSAARLCRGANAAVFRTDGRTIDHPATYGALPDAYAEVVREYYPMPLTRRTQQGQAMLQRSVVYLEDSEAPSTPPLLREAARRLGFRSQVTIPMLRDDQPVGAITVSRAQPGRFADSEVALLRSFADQAVIAIENVRLFTELQEKNRALTEAHAQVTESLEQQTATSEILRVISQSKTDVQPVFDAILHSAVRLLRGYSGVMTRSAGDQIELAALTSTDEAGDAATRGVFPHSHQTEGPHSQAMRDRTPINISDAQTDRRVSEGVRANARARGTRSWVVVPLLRHDEAVGTIAVTRREAGGFSDDEIALLQTFADQAVIAIENARLLTELHARTEELGRSVEQLTALGEVGRAVSSTLDLETVLTTIVARAVQLSGMDGGVVFEYDQGTEEFVLRVATETGGALAQARRSTRIRKGEGVLGRTAITLEAVQVPDIVQPGAYEGRLRETLLEAGVRAVLAVPMVYEGHLIGSLGVTRNRPGEFSAETIELLRTFATQSALAIQNARLFQEIEDTSRQLEAASRHKSEFLANMSHELRTPLNAVIGFSEVLLQRMFGQLNAKQDEYLKDIYASGQHLLSLINDILDLSKIEAGRMELTPAPFHLPSALENAVTLVKERAARHGITLELDVDPGLGELVGDERKVKQVLLNLLSNAVKFTPEGGRISLKAARRDDTVEIAVTDTGIGIAPEDQAAIFEEFRQVGSDELRKQEGTGLGLTLAKKFVELHGGRIWVESAPGRGSTFTFTLPAG